MSLDKAMKNLKLDVRLLERNLTTGQITSKELEDHLKTLPDCANNIDIVNIGPNSDKKAEQHH